MKSKRDDEVKNMDNYASAQEKDRSWKQAYVASNWKRYTLDTPTRFHMKGAVAYTWKCTQLLVDADVHTPL